MAQEWVPSVLTLILIPAVGALSLIVLNTRTWLGKVEGKVAEDVGDIHTLIERRLGESATERVQQIAGAKAEAKAYADAHRGASDMAIIAMQSALQTFQIKVLEGYVTNRHMEGFEKRIMDLLENMSTKIDKLNERERG